MSPQNTVVAIYRTHTETEDFLEARPSQLSLYTVEAVAASNA